MFNNMLFLLLTLLAQATATDKFEKTEERELNYYAPLFDPSKTTIKKGFAFEENRPDIFSDVDVESLSTQPTDYRSDKTKGSDKSKSEYSAWVSNPYTSRHGYNPSMSNSSMFSNTCRRDRYYPSTAGNYSNQSRTPHAQFSLNKKEFVSDADLKLKEDSEKQRQAFLADDPQSQCVQKVENILSKEIIQLPEIQRSIDEYVQRQILQREMKKQQLFREKQAKEAFHREEKEMLDKFWVDEEEIDYFPTPEMHKRMFELTEVEDEKNRESIVQKYAPEELIGIISKKYSSNSYNPQHKPKEFSYRLSRIQEWFGYEVFLKDGMTDGQYYAKNGYNKWGRGTIFGENSKGNEQFSDVLRFHKQNGVVRGPALEALSVLVPMWWKNEENIADIKYDASWIHWDLTKLLAGRIGIDLNQKPELAFCFMIKKFDYEGVERLLEGFKKLPNTKYGKDEYGRYIYVEAEDLLWEIKNSWKV